MFVNQNLKTSLSDPSFEPAANGRPSDQQPNGCREERRALAGIERGPEWQSRHPTSDSGS